MQLLVSGNHSFASSIEECIRVTKYSANFAYNVALNDIDPETAKPLCLEALKLDKANKDVLMGLGRIKEKERKYIEAKEFYNQAFKLGSGAAAQHIAVLYYWKDLPADDRWATTFSWNKKAEELGSAKAFFNLGIHYEYGYYVKADFKKALEYYKKAADNNSSDGNIALAGTYHYGDLGLDINLELAKKYYKKEHNIGNPDGTIGLAEIAIENPNDDLDIINAMSVFSKIAETGSIDAMASFVYYNLVPSDIEAIRETWPEYQPDPTKALDYLLAILDDEVGAINATYALDSNIYQYLSKEQRNTLLDKLKSIIENEGSINSYVISEIAYSLAYIYSEGLTGPEDSEMALPFYKKAAELGNQNAMIDLGWLFFADPKLQNYKEAIKYTSKVAKQKDDNYNSAWAYNNLGVIYETNGEYELAAKNYKKAVNLMNDSDYNGSYSAGNLARLFITGRLKGGIDPELAKKYAKIASDQGETFLYSFLNRYNLKASTSIKEIQAWFEEMALEGKTEGLIEIAWLYQKSGDAKAAIKWFTLCTFLCEEENNIILSNEGLSRLKKDTSGAVYRSGERNAREWQKVVWSKRTGQDVLDDNLQKKKTPSNTSQDKYFALLIGINEYSDLSPLQTPLRDVTRIASILEENYGFKNTVLENPSRQEILNELNNFKKFLSENDNLLIYYAGHGVLDEGEGFWLPKDASRANDINWISNSYLKRKLKSYAAKNVLIIADSCFSGSLTRDIKIVDIEDTEKDTLKLFMQTKSRVAISSGGNEPVFDGGGDGFSLFAKIFISHLENYNQSFTAMDLYSKLRPDVVDLSMTKGNPQTPYYGELIDAGHEGPDFVFVKKD